MYLKEQQECKHKFLFCAVVWHHFYMKKFKCNKCSKLLYKKYPKKIRDFENQLIIRLKNLGVKNEKWNS